MKSFVLIAAMLFAACGGDDGDVDHTVGACGASWGSASAMCEAACAEVPGAGSGNSSCKIDFDFDPFDGQPGGFCPNTLTTSDGGCCVPLQGKVTWTACE